MRGAGVMNMKLNRGAGYFLDSRGATPHFIANDRKRTSSAGCEHDRSLWINHNLTPLFKLDVGAAVSSETRQQLFVVHSVNRDTQYPVDSS